LIDADHAAIQVDERAAGIPGVDRRRRLAQSLEDVTAAVLVVDRFRTIEAGDDADDGRLGRKAERERIRRSRNLGGSSSVAEANPASCSRRRRVQETVAP
jgi:hypothetical protein